MNFILVALFALLILAKPTIVEREVALWLRLHAEFRYQVPDLQRIGAGKFFSWFFSLNRLHHFATYFILKNHSI